MIIVLNPYIFSSSTGASRTVTLNAVAGTTYYFSVDSDTGCLRYSEQLLPSQILVNKHLEKIATAGVFFILFGYFKSKVNQDYFVLPLKNLL